LNESNKINILKNNPSLNEGRKMANAKRKAKNQANQIKRERQELEKYINAAGLNKGNKLNILKNNPSLNEGKKLVNSMLQNKIKEKRNKDKLALQIFLNKLGLNKNRGEQKEFFDNFDKNVNINTIKTKATIFAKNKKNRGKTEKRQELQKHLVNLGLTNQEQAQFLNKFNTDVNNANALKIKASKFINQRTKERRATTRQELVTYLKTLTLNSDNVNRILKQFDETTTNIETFKWRAKKINNSRKEEKWVETEDEFYAYLNTLKNLTPQNKTEITSKLNSEFVNWNALKKGATNLAVQRARERRQREKDELLKFANELGLNKMATNVLLRKIDDGIKNLTELKNEAKELKKQKNTETKTKKRKELSSILSGFDLTNKNQADFIERFNNNTVTFNDILSEAKELASKRTSTRKDELVVFMTNIGLEQNDRNLILKNFDANPRSMNVLRKRAQELKSTRNVQERKRIREELRNYLNTLNMLNKRNKNKLLANKSRTYNNVKNEANRLQEFKKLANNTRSYNNVKNEANQLQEFKKNVQEKKRIREELRSYLNTLNMLNKSNKKKLLANNTRSYNNVKNEANQLQETKKKIKEQQELRVELRKYLNTLNMLNKIQQTEVIG
jgi:hypothetical protein